ncbi:MAG: N-acyl homoserine lactonase family protein [Candidatus Promineifilaceae bacterium]
MNTVKRLYILDFGLFQVHQNNRVIGIPGYLIQTHNGKNILVDTGFPAKYVEDVESATLEDGLESFGRIVSLSAENLPAAQLRKIGLKLSDIDTLVMTHTHIDHVGGIGDFPNVPIVIHADERALDQPIYWNDRSPIPWPDNECQLIDADCELCPGVMLLTTPGHALGHLSLLVRLPETGAVLLTGDAISRSAELEEGFGGSWNAELAQASADKLMALAKHENAFIVYGHDPEQWPTLKKAPQAYS